MTLDVAGDTAAVLVEDDPGEAVTNVGGLGTQFLADHGWIGCCTDGFVIGTLEGAWQVDAQFTLLVGIPQWQATSADGSSIPLVPDLNRRARLSALSACDRDNDGVSNDVDFCPDNTELDESVPTSGALNPNHWALTDGDGVFDTVLKGKGKGPNRSYTIEDTAGCSCEQIIEIQGLGAGHSKHGCSISAMDDWLDFVNP